MGVEEGVIQCKGGRKSLFVCRGVETAWIFNPQRPSPENRQTCWLYRVKRGVQGSKGDAVAQSNPTREYAQYTIQTKNNSHQQQEEQQKQCEIIK